MTDQQREQFTAVSYEIHNEIVERDRKLVGVTDDKLRKQIFLDSDATLEPLWNKLIALKK